MERRIYSEARQTAAACALHIAASLQTAMEARSTATLAISGGTTPRWMLEELRRASIEWKRLQLFWVDERCVPPTDKLSNYRMARAALLDAVPIPAENVHRIRGELAPQEAASRYEAELLATLGPHPILDVIQQGVGADAHTASLFPGEPLITDENRAVAAVYATKLDQWRVTLLPSILNSARENVFLVSGADKADAIRIVFEEPMDVKAWPAQIARSCPQPVFFLDAAGASGLAAVG